MADDAELEAIRQRRIAELMSSQGQKPLTPEEQQQQEEAKQAADEQRRAMLMAVLQPEARERLSRIALVKPQKARSVEDMILHAARRGSLQEKVTEGRLIELLEQVNQQTSTQTKVTIQRRRAFYDDGDDDE